MVAPDTITSVGGGRIVTDASCSVGCPSVRWTERRITYDARTGAVVSDVSFEEPKSYNEELDELRERLTNAADKLGVDSARCCTYRGVAPDALAFSPTGALVAATVAGSPRVWDGASGRLILR
jgi:hypothetical protein